MAPGRASRHEHETGIASVLGDVLLHPRERQLAVEDMARPPRLRAQGVIGGHAHKAPLGEMLEHRDALLALVAHHPRTAVEVQENRRCDRPFKSRLAIDVEAMGVDRVVGVSDVAEPFDASWPDRHRPEANCATRPAHAIAASARPTQPGQLPKPPPDPQPTVTAITTATKCSGASPTIQLGTKEKLEPTRPRSGRREVSESTSATTPTAKHAQLTLACYR